MNRSTAHSLLIGVLFLAAGCGKQPMRKQLSPYQQYSNQVLSEMARGVYEAKAAVLGGPSSGRGIRGGFGAPGGAGTIGGGFGAGATSTSPYYGGGYSSSMRSETSSCISQVQFMDRTAANYSLMVATLTQCLDRILISRNPMFSFGYRNLGNSGQNFMNMLIDPRGLSGVPGSAGFSGFGNDLLSGLMITPGLLGGSGGFGIPR